VPAISAYAPGKIILFGEHAVVYGQPAIAVPVTQIHARAIVEANIRAPAGQVRLVAPAVALDSLLDELPADQPLAVAVRAVLSVLGICRSPACTIRVTSSIPVAAGLGSGAAVTVAVLRAFSAFLGHPLEDEAISSMAYEVEKLYHGTPSGIDNTVITYVLPVYFVRGQPVHTFQVAEPFQIVIGDTGVSSPTAISVADVRQAWKNNPTHYEHLFHQIGQITQTARQIMENGVSEKLGPLMNANHTLLQQIGVSSPELDCLVDAARQAGALGAKLSGGGRGGNMIALVSTENSAGVLQALQHSGAVRTLVTEVG
jgi:mevalonate kinase